MKKGISAVAVIALTIGLTACQNKKENAQTNSDTQTENVAKKQEPYADAKLKNTYTAKLGGKVYDIKITRYPDKQHPAITDELGNKFYDNCAEILISCQGSVFYSKNYTKADFDKLLTDNERLGTILLGMAYDMEKSDNKYIRLGAQIGQVGIEEGPAFSIAIPLDGSTPQITRDNNQDTTGNAGSNTEE